MATFALCGIVFLTSCAPMAPHGSVPAGCSGVPGDLRTPSEAERAPQSLPQFGVSVEPEERVAVARPFNRSAIALLYVFDEHAAHVTSGTPMAKLLDDPVFAQVEAEAYWSEVADGHFYRLPWQDKCSQASMLSDPISFQAPPHGLLFMQYVVPSCNECDRITAAIRAVISAHPEMPVRWVRIRIPASIGRLQKSY